MPQGYQVPSAAPEFLNHGLLSSYGANRLSVTPSDVPKSETTEARIYGSGYVKTDLLLRNVRHLVDLIRFLSGEDSVLHGAYLYSMDRTVPATFLLNNPICRARGHRTALSKEDTMWSSSTLTAWV